MTKHYLKVLAWQQPGTDCACAQGEVQPHAVGKSEVLDTRSTKRLMSGLQGTKLMTPEKARAIWAIYVWCRRTDELVDGPNASRMNPRVRTKGRGLREGLVEFSLWQGACSCMHRA